MLALKLKFKQDKQSSMAAWQRHTYIYNTLVHTSKVFVVFYAHCAVYKAGFSVQVQQCDSVVACWL